MRPSDLDQLLGEPMRGTLTYLDYTSGRTQIIRSTLQVARKDDADNTWEVKIGYSDEPDKATAEVLAITADGRKLGNETVVERADLPGGAVRVVTTEQGSDDNRPATIRYVYTLGPRACSVEKLVCFTGQSAYFQRNIYRWSR